MRLKTIGAVSKRPFMAVALATVCTPVLGCGLLEEFEDTGGVVDVFTAHTGSVVDGQFADNGEPGMARNFTNDLGWQITLGEAYVTTAGVDLATCSGNTVKRVDLFWGPSAENIVDIADAEPKGIGGVRSEAANYCQLRVNYGPYSFAAASTDGADHAPPANELMEGQTVMLRGYAEKDGEVVPFDFVSSFELSVVVDTSKIRGGKPLEVETDQSFPVKVVLTKTYDRFFDGIDFTAYEDVDLEAAVAAALQLDSGVVLDVDVRPPA